MPSVANSGCLPFDGVLAIPNVVHFEKPAHNTLNPSCFKKNLYEHTGMGVYRNFVSLREAELKKNLTQPARKYVFNCPYCGQGYMRRLCLVKHIHRLHENGGTSGNVRPDLMAKTPEVPVSSAFPTSSTDEPSSLRPVVRVTVPTSSSSFQQCKDDHKDKTLDANASHVASSNSTLLPPLDGNVHHNRALTVSLPNEVSIPAGCVVELVEVKTVNGMKELKLRLISKEENESVIKTTRTTASSDTTQEKQSSLALPSADIVKSVSLERQAIHGTLNEASIRSVEHPGAVPSVGHQLNQTNSIKVGLKRSSPDMISLDCSNSQPKRLPRSLSPLQIHSGIKDLQRDTVNHSSPTSSMGPTLVVNRATDSQSRQNLDTCVSQSAVEKRKYRLYEQASAILPRRLSVNKGIPRDMPVGLESHNVHLKRNVRSSSICIPPSHQTRTSPVLIRKKNLISQRFLLPKILNEPVSLPTSLLSDCTKPKKSIQKREVKSDEMERELFTKDIQSFPVISSVFSLSQQPGNVQGSHEPLVMALRGIVIDEDESPASLTDDLVTLNDGGEQGKEMPLLENSVEADAKPKTTDLDLLSANIACESVKIEDSHKATQYEPPSDHSCVKTEKHDPGATGIDKCPPTPDSKPLEDTKLVPDTVPNVISSAKVEPKVEGNGLNNCSKFPIVSLKRIQVGRKYNKELSLKASKPKHRVCTDIFGKCTLRHLLPLNIDQVVKRPGLNQPVVVLNHPMPRDSAQGAGADACAHAGTSKSVPKCQILKMRLSKVMGQKYEVKGCTVGVSQ